MKPFGFCLSNLRRIRGLQQQQLANMINLSPCYISAMESGQKPPPRQEIVDSIIICLNLDNKEKQELLDAADCSKPSRRVPKGASLHEYRFIDDLWRRLGTLSEHETLAMSYLLKINGKDKGGDYR
ncbi:helix-turn-helix transcriptional regulator [Aestuariicella sp. G3-2]|uniref:helix-turn-helix domain-containing protein n=1 Tax=Pseudomaricurvus albidus TaxID=2842452 RepID=UPI001C0C2B41|nr:helix-turn-helix transcriptional regulator [Aestuariicella albida]MBU3068261.1 helix-turn-helix transcriptional regulator [Aestuariicella albida]